MPRVLLPVGGAVALVVVLAAAALSSERTTEADLARAQGELGLARDAIVTHAAVLRTQGQRLLQVTQISTSAHREHWITDAQQMIADAATLDDTARTVGNQAALLGAHPGQAARIDLSFVHSTGAGLVAAGEQLVAHGAAMREHALAMEQLARLSDTDIAPTDVALLRDGADRVTDAGDRMRSVGGLLERVGEQFMRSLGR
jgi:hypothetical protein